ncbi:uncharacterized protein N7515_001316 [Penicillium bovifimosum]|uniref:Uncharacterized protein n=1 Tax=Penicillium bovifimosum TaxID=126998 RepID=A0A9W9L8L0_9EURO|nr:uncharacterized protein N7515_001316 [Penicillium bovifimosum]KAJ5142529.1 hypothetical protein N7515_001316 [Penicillium bovifimosum]
MAQPMGQISSVDNSTSTDTDINAESHTIPAVDLPDPDRLAYLTEVIDLPRHPPRREPTAKAFVGPASRKTLAARDQGRERSTAVFPLWTRQDGFGVISIYKGAEQILYIENDRVPLGATVHFEDKPDLRIVKHK